LMRSFSSMRSLGFNGLRSSSFFGVKSTTTAVDLSDDRAGQDAAPVYHRDKEPDSPVIDNNHNKKQQRFYKAL
jgi:hypothetical protein